MTTSSLCRLGAGTRASSLLRWSSSSLNLMSWVCCRQSFGPVAPTYRACATLSAPVSWHTRTGGLHPARLMLGAVTTTTEATTNVATEATTPPRAWRAMTRWTSALLGMVSGARAPGHPPQPPRMAWTGALLGGGTPTQPLGEALSGSVQSYARSRAPAWSSTRPWPLELLSRPPPKNRHSARRRSSPPPRRPSSAPRRRWEDSSTTSSMPPRTYYRWAAAPRLRHRRLGTGGPRSPTPSFGLGHRRLGCSY